MAYIYQIVNDINDKVYVGKTESSIKKRFNEHCRDYLKRSEEHRPLYAAMKKYGIEHFHIELIEETDNPEEREIYWIEQKGSFKYGYNATRGGDGKHYADYDLIYELWQKGYEVQGITALTGYDRQTIASALNNHNVTETDRRKRSQEKFGKAIAQIDPKTNEVIKVFPTICEARRLYNTPHIVDVIHGRRKTAAGYKWKLLSDIQEDIK